MLWLVFRRMIIRDLGGIFLFYALEEFGRLP